MSGYRPAAGAPSGLVSERALREHLAAQARPLPQLRANPERPEDDRPSAFRNGDCAQAPPGVDGARFDTEGYSGHIPHRDVSFIRNPTDAMRSSEVLQSIHDPSAETRRMLASSTHLPAPQSGRAQPPRSSGIPSGGPHRADYEHMGAIEGYAGHRPTPPRHDHFGTRGTDEYHLGAPVDKESSSDHGVFLFPHGVGLVIR